ncbi:cupin domain-containing protein [Escherichia marmotae]|uniref:(R)-mandelonitrile lyase n=1 Tax=Escherichia TaxID=561 RepID=UPI000A188CFF|nr:MULTISPECIES: cupin domain-containing protein [Escherichia]MBB2410671.1 cupin domain-containing protein [Escherichia sp. 14.0985]MBB2429077.1 cupin domain-containing protein [Escherichia sp. 12.2612]MBB2452458.1 cupin domain-containing protein [Escherichia sp. 8.2195]MDQ9207943.1 cupin domain-containing protein [Escherichia marmotae]MDQ9305325.1 cupin domain-containing protein [Escherichia marmotae]
MIRLLRYLGLLLPLFTASSWAVEQNSAVHIAPAGSQNAVYGSAENFTGRVRVDPLFNADNDIRVSAAYVTFEPGARSAWHTHPAGQRLIVTAGVGLTQQEGQPVQVIRAGDVVSCPAGVKHWYGAAPGSAMTHLAITGVVDGKSVNWKELVTDEQYHAH